MDFSGFKPENVKVTLKDRDLTIQANMDEKSDDGLQRICQNITRQYSIPENVDLENMKSLLTENGILVIEAPLIGQKAKAGPRDIPIERTSTENPSAKKD